MINRVVTLCSSCVRAPWQRNHSDSYRVALQSVVAAVVSYVTGRIFDFPDVSWVILSSVCAIQVHFDSTLRLGLGQVWGAILGTAVGAASVLVFHHSGETVLRVLLASGIMSMATVLWPQLGFGIAAAAVTALHPYVSGYDTAMRALSIVVGSCEGVCVSLLVYRQWGRDRAAGYIAAAIDDCRMLLDAMTDFSNVATEADREELHERFLCNLESARGVASVTKVRARIKTGKSLYSTIFAVERLWHGLNILDRAIRTEMGQDGANAFDYVKEPINDVHLAGDKFLLQLTSHLTSSATKQSNASFPDATTLHASITELDRCFRENVSGRADEAKVQHPFHSLLFGIQQAYNDLLLLAKATSSATADTCDSAAGGRR